MTDQTPTIHGVFPCPVYNVKRDSDLTPTEEKEIGKIIRGGLYKNAGNSTSFEDKVFNIDELKKIKQFCEQHLKKYVEQVICPEEEVDFYITQSWINVTKPGEFHHPHSHPNSIVSGVFYIATEEDDTFTLEDPNYRIKQIIKFEPTEYNAWNSIAWTLPSKNNELLLFPSWIKHRVEVNERATRDRISISFNTFVRGIMGRKDRLNEIIIK